MKNPIEGKTVRIGTAWFAKSAGIHLLLLLGCLVIGLSKASALVLYTNDFEAYTTVATDLSDASDADPVGTEWNVADDAALNPNTAGAGVQVINWLARSGSKALLLRSSSEAQIFFPNAKSGTNYTLDFWVHAVRGAGDRNWYLILGAMGADSNGDDYFAYRTDRATSSNIFYFDGIGPGTAAFIDTGVDHVDNQWQHHRIVMDALSRKCSIYVDDMLNPVVTDADLARPDSPVPSRLILRHEGNSADDGYAVIDDVSFTVDGNLIDLTSTYTDGFEAYPARVAVDDDADPAGPWIVVESIGNGSGREIAPAKVQVVDNTVVTPRSGTKCLKIEGGQRAGASVAWGVPAQSDVQITWWARVPEAVQSAPTADAVYLRMSLYGAEGDNAYAGDSALLGHGIRRQSNTNCVDATSLIYFLNGWQDTTADYVGGIWEEYRLTTHNSQGRYTIIKNPSSANPVVVVDRAGFVGSAVSWGPTFMAAWSSSNGADHPPVYIDDIEVKTLVSNPAPLGEPYSVTNYGTRFTNHSIVTVNGAVGRPVVDPRDNSTILFTTDIAGGGIHLARKIANGNWSIDPQPIVTGLDRPSGLCIEPNGNIWWTHDFTMALMRLKWPWSNNVPETIISNFGATETDDDPIDVAVAPANFTGALGQPGMIVVADRGVDGDANNTIYLVDPATTTLNQTTYTTYLVNPTGGDLGDNLNAITPLPNSGEMVTVSGDGTLVAVNGDGVTRYINTANLWPFGAPASGAAIAVDPTTGRIWAADDLKDEIWSIDSTNAADQVEIGFPLTDPLRPDRQIDFHDPGMAFAPNGAFMVVTDSSLANGANGRLIIFHNDVPAIPQFNITTAVRVGQSFQLSWESAGAVKYRVLRGTTPDNLQEITGDLTGTEYTDANPPAEGAFYRVVAKP